MWILCCILLIMFAVLVWCMLAFAFKSIGKVSIKFFGDPFKIMNEEDEREDEKNE